MSYKERLQQLQEQAASLSEEESKQLMFQRWDDEGPSPTDFQGGSPGQ